MKVSINGYVYNYANNTPMKDVKVTGAFKAQKTDSLGHYLISGLSAGNYQLTFTADSFGVMIDTISVSSKDNNFTEYTVDLKTQMYKMNQILNTQLLIDLGGKYVPAANAKYSITLGNKFTPNKIEGVADANGMISMAKLPDMPVTLSVTLQYNNKEYRIQDGIYNGNVTVYNDYIINDPKSFAKTILLEVFSNNESFYVTATNLLDNNGITVKNFNTASNITFSFSLAVDTTNNSNRVYLRKSTSSNYLPCTVTWSQDSKSMTIDPAYKLEAGLNYNVLIELSTADGLGIYRYFYFSTSGSASADFQLFQTNLNDEFGNQQLNFNKSDNIVLTFTSAANINNPSNHIRLTKSGNNVACSTSWSADAKTVTIDPIGAYLESGANYTLDIQIYPKNTANQYYSNYLYFKVAGSAQTVQLGKVLNVTKTYPSTIILNTSYIQIQVDNVSNASYYAVYAKYSNGEFIQLTTFSNSFSTTSSTYLYLTNLSNIVVPTDGLFSNNAEYDLIVRAETYSGAVGEFSDVLVLKNGSK
jgi:hypothetical protein